MRVIDYSECALAEDVIIKNSDDNSYALLVGKEKSMTGRSPLEDIPRVKLNITTQEIVEMLRESRAGM
jgi:hypothetical protein